MRRLIVNADDFGLTEGVSYGILHAHHYGIVTSASLMANGEAFEMAVALCRRAPRLSVGVHLALTQGAPVSPALQIRSLVDDRGRLPRSPWILAYRLLTHRVSLREIEIELRAQIAKVLLAGIIPTHLDGHQHVHVLPGISGIVAKLAQEFCISSLRCPIEENPVSIRPLHDRRSPHAAVLRQYLTSQGVSWFARRFRVKMGQAELSSPTHFHGLSQTGYLNLETLQQILFSLPEGTSELMCHPGYADSALAKTGTRLLSQREVEARTLMGFQPQELAADLGIQLISYHDLAAEVSNRQEAVRHLEVPKEVFK